MRTLAVIVALLIISAAIAEPISDADTKRDARNFAAMSGWNCPDPISFESKGEDARGEISMVECQSSDGKKVWKLRFIHPPKGYGRVEPW